MQAMLTMQAMASFRKLLDDKNWSVSKLAAALKIKPQAISQWIEVPLNRVPEVEALTGIPRHELRPDFWQAPKKGKAA
jgi:DNA-binding transcriptional regulator YdaS (Cro superfamily)